MVMVDAVRGQITSGELKPGDRLPSNLQLINRFDLSQGSVRRAMLTLKADGLVYGRPGVGVFVADPRRSGGR